MPEPSRRTPALPRLVQPLQEFLSTETAGGVLLLAATVAALVWANAPFSDSYLFIGDLAFHDAALQQEAKIGVLAGFAVMGLAGLAALLLMSRRREATSPH